MSDVVGDKCGVCGAEFDRAYTQDEVAAMKIMASVPPVQLIEGNFSRVRVRAQDVVVITSPQFLLPEQIQAIIDGLRPMFPGNKIVVLDEGLEIGVMAPIRDEDCDQDDDDDS